MRLDTWLPSRWPDFRVAEIACPCCGEIYIDGPAMDALQTLRAAIASPLILTSAHRCALHNARVGGAPMSEHKQLAFDIAIGPHDRGLLLTRARESGFRGFGFGQTFLHADTRARAAHWFYGPKSQTAWQGAIP